VTGWIARYLDYAEKVPEAVASFVATNSVCQGQQATEIWPVVFSNNIEIRFAHVPFKWSNLASRNAGVTVIIIGLAKQASGPKKLFDDDLVHDCNVIGPYLVPNITSVVTKVSHPLGQQAKMLFGNMPRDGGHLFISAEEAGVLRADEKTCDFVRRFLGAEELINGKQRFCLWIKEDSLEQASSSSFISNRLELVALNRNVSQAKSTRDFAKEPFRFVQIAGEARETVIVVPGVSSENREFLPVDLLSSETVIGNSNFALYDAPLWNMALIASRIHLVWISTVCGKLETRFRYSNTLGWNTFPVPKLTGNNKKDLTRCAEDILLAREAHFPATIADLYDSENMPEDLRRAHDRNDEVLERIYIGRRFRNDTERLEKLFALYTKMTTDSNKTNKTKMKVS